MSDTAEDEQQAAFVRFLSIIYQVITEKVIDFKLSFRQCAMLKELSVMEFPARTLMENSTVLDLTVADATIDLLIVNLQKGIWNLE